MTPKKDAKRVVYIAMDEKIERWWRKLIRVMKIASCLELPNKGLGRRKMLLGLVALKMEVGW